MRAILIDVVNRFLKEIQVGSSLEDYYKIINCGSIEVAIRLPNEDVCYVDEEGLLKKANFFFFIKGGIHVFAGNGIIVGTGREGESIDAKSSMEEIKQRVSFLTRTELESLFGLS